MKRTHLPRLLPALLAVTIGIIACRPGKNNTGTTLSGSSDKLRSTAIAPTLAHKMGPGTNVVWCASFLASWKTLASDLAKQPPAVDGNPAIVSFLNNAADPKPHIPAANLYTASGWNNKGVTDQIVAALAARFPGKTPPSFPGILPDSFVAYAYLDANVTFAMPYFQNAEPLVFSNSTGRATRLSSFGIRPKDDYAYFKLRQQPLVLFATTGTNDHFTLDEFAVDLDARSTPSQIVLAVVKPMPTLHQTLAYVEGKINAAALKGKREGLGPNDVLLVPDIAWNISHRFKELEGRSFTNSALRGQRIDVAQQDISFRLSRSGAELKSEAKQYMAPVPSYYVFTRPFLLYMKQRGARLPYFVMWVDNEELLTRW